MTYTDLRPWDTRIVQVLVRDTWHDGELLVVRKRAGRWQGWVRSHEGVGAQRLGWSDEELLKRSLDVDRG